jgi:hypothetical protein
MTDAPRIQARYDVWTQPLGTAILPLLIVEMKPGNEGQMLSDQMTTARGLRPGDEKPATMSDQR